MLDRLKQWWTLDQAAEENSADNPLTALREDQRRNSGPLLALAFGWGFLVTGLFTGTQLGNGIPFWPDIIYTTFLVNLAYFFVCARYRLFYIRKASNFLFWFCIFISFYILVYLRILY